jgi:hypothetical protein
VTDTHIEWSRHFDRAYCFHFVEDRARLPGITGEFSRIGLLDSGIFRWCNTFPNPWEKRLIEAYPKIWRAGPNRTALGFLNLGMASMRCLREALADGCRRVLFLEDDIRFLRSLVSIEDALSAMPDNFDIVQFDKFEKKTTTPEAYAEKIVSDSVNVHYFDAKGKLYSSGGCFMATDRGMANMLRAMEEWRPGPMDGYLTMNGNRVAIAKRNLAIQIVMGDAMVLGYNGGRNTHHAAYAPQGIVYEEYAVPDGYGYGAETAKG